jgi:outer membrane biosynthesis protein TonB
LPTNEDGEFELILGNRQLLSVFFIVVILLAVFFAMGYIVARKVTPAGPEMAATSKPDVKPLVVESPVRQAEAAKIQSKPDAPATTPTETAAQQPVEQPKPVESAKPEVVKPEPVKESKASKKEKPAPAAAGQSSEPKTGQTYLQLTATNKALAETYVNVLRKKNFQAIAAQIPEKPDLYRVLVGPIPEGATNKTKSELQRSGFPGDQAIRKTF